MKNNQIGNGTQITFRRIIKPLNVWQFLLTGVAFAVVFQYFLWSGSFEKLSTAVLAFFWIITIYYTQYLGHSYLRLLLDEKMSWEKHPVKKLILSVIIKTVYAVFAYLLVTIVFSYFAFGSSFREVFTIASKGVKLAIFFTFIFAFIFSSISFYVNWQKTKLKAEKLQKELANYRYNTLKTQVNPHFLFNSLNVLADLVHEDADLSEKYIHQLSDIYRYVLESTKHKMVPLAEEMAFIKSYVFLLKIRFEQKLKIDLNITPHENEFIIPVSIQTLLENAIKHNEVTSELPLSVSIERDGDFIAVKNNLQLKNSMREPSGTGLENLKQQYDLISNKQIQIENTAESFIVKLPILMEKQKQS